MIKKKQHDLDDKCAGMDEKDDDGYDGDDDD